MVHESEISLKELTEKKFLRVALYPLGRYCWDEDENPIEYTPSELLQAGLHLLKILERLCYDYGILHCDIKPDNIIVRDSKLEPELIDFGMAIFVGKSPYGFTKNYVSENHLVDTTFLYTPTLWDDVESLLFTLHAMSIGVTKFDRMPLRQVLIQTPITQEIAIPRTCCYDMMSIATADPSFSWNLLQDEISHSH